MGHNIHYNERTGKHSFFSVKQPAWHKLGKVLENYPTSKEAIQFAGLDYEVVKAPLFTKREGIGDGENGPDNSSTEIPVPDQFATMRTDTQKVFGVVGKDYGIVQNRDAFSFFDAIIKEGKGVKYETAGALGEGERVFITAKLPDGILVGKEDLIEQYLFLTTSHDGTGSIMAAFTPIRVVCQNTLNAAFQRKTNVVRIRHTSGAKERLQLAHRLMGLVTETGANLETVFNRWAKVKIKDKEVKRLIELALAPNRDTLDNLYRGEYDKVSTAFKNQCEEAFAYAMMGDAQLLPSTEGTVFGTYNAVTGYFQNVRRFKSEQDKTRSILLGGTAQLKGQKAFDLCADFVDRGAKILVHK